MDRGRDGVLKTLVGVGREVDRDARAGSNRSGNLDIQRDLTVGAVGIAGRVGAAIDRHGLANADIVGPIEYRADDGFAPHACGGEHSHADVLGIENLAVKGMQGRGVLVDLVAHYAREHRTVGYDDLMFAIEADGVQIERGDMLVLRTGFAEMVLEMNRQPDEAVLDSHCCALDGRDERLLHWLTESGIAALAA